ncbi:MAG TPA: hypothetical protein VL172_04630 [Kofleriaceae bacterium]|nr:hypothetical protein [Kofleriaceae bacterium]
MERLLAQHQLLLRHGLVQRHGLPVALLLAAACSRAGAESEAKRSPRTPPPQSVAVPADLRIEVEVDGKPAAPITAAQLQGLAPDFADGERSAWKLSALLGAAFERPGAVAEALSADGEGVLLHQPSAAGGPAPVLYLTRRGVLVAAMVDPDKPFPAYHGQGGQLQRPGDKRPRLSGVVRLRVRVDSAGAGDADRSAAGRQALLAVAVTIGGKPTALTAEQVDALPRRSVQGDEGDQRAAWSLRDLVNAVAGAGARVTTVTGESGPVAVAASWKDAALTPLLRANRRGELKLMWVDAQGAARLEGEVRGVKSIEIQR